MKASGTFDVQLEPQTEDSAPAGRMILQKTYTGDLEGTASGQMLSKRTTDGGSAYAAVEEFKGRLAGRSGGFTLIHNGYMDASEQRLDVYILAGSGTGELSGITGTLEILQEAGQHRYLLNYSL